MTAQKSALVFGATGFIGGHLLRELRNSPLGHDVKALMRRQIVDRRLKLRPFLSDYQSISVVEPDLAEDDIFCCLATKPLGFVPGWGCRITKLLLSDERGDRI